MWLGSGVAVAVVSAPTAAPIPPPAWKFPYAEGLAIKKKKKKIERKKYPIFLKLVVKFK